MLYGLYLSAQGANAQSQRLDVIANNLANASTAGFQRDLALFRQLDPHDVAHGLESEVPGNLNDSTGGLMLDDVVTDFSDGSLTKSGRDLDVAITGPGFLQVSNGTQQFLTRDGQLAMNVQGELITQNRGFKVLSDSGSPIVVPAGTQQIAISEDGVVSASLDGQTSSVLGRLNLLQPQKLNELQKLGEGLFQTTETPPAASPAVKVHQGFVENSGANPITDMLQMIDASRAFESNVNVAKHQDEALGQLLGSLARV